MLTLAVMAGVAVAPSSRDASADLASSGSATEVQPVLFSQEPQGLLGYCTVDCSRCSSNQECLSRGAGACTNIPACRQ
ncbi:hypothetical protein LZ198_10350 [Myxococcus sp. K15C18031901]|uniref:hypothetical protein n=1 Tax=Myxococcus dinghuensis TaxID=2906761 RepID=UPI0020A7718E|nr:hypothetical protein [Myxococcus dinghuensis]MCP3099271.1 hypothetical protein [Myxococcus dinghuensis]